MATKGGPDRGTEQESKKDYYDACEFFQERLKNQQLKERYDKDDFWRVARYLSKYFENDGRTPAEAAMRQLVEKKAYWYSMAREKQTELQDRRDAEIFVSQFYGNIINAMVQEESFAIAEVSKAVESSEGKESRIEIVNCLESAICIYFLKRFKETLGVLKTQTLQDV